MLRSKSLPAALSRRNFLGTALAGSAAALLGTSTGILATRAAFAQTNMTPDQALKELLDGNQRYLAGNFTSFDEDKQILRDRTVEKQQPFASILSCADSRVPIEIIFDQSIGELFVTRIAGNVATSEIIASLEFGAGVLGTRVIMVLGHSGCGAVKAAIANNEVPGQISALFPHLRAAVNLAGPDLVAATKANAAIQAALLSKSSTVLAPMVTEGKLKIVGAYYDLGTGKVTLV